MKILRIDEFAQVNKRDFISTTTDDVVGKEKSEIEQRFETERRIVYGMSKQELVDSLKKYVRDYYKMYPKEYREAKKAGYSSLNWGELDSPEYIVADYVCDILIRETQQEIPMSEKDKEIADLAFSIADEYLK